MPNYGNNPLDRRTLPNFAQTYVEWYDTRRGVRKISRRQRANGSADLDDIIDMLDILIEQHQMTFVIDNNYRWRIYFPYMFVKPEVGDMLRNKVTGEEYEIIYVEVLPPNFKRLKYGPICRNPKTDIFTGLVILEQGTNPPKPTDTLEYVNKEKRLIDFFEWSTRRNSKKPSGSGEGDLGQGEDGKFMPTITWSVNRVEPGSIGKSPFDNSKMLKAQMRETYTDPSHTYLLDSPGYYEAKKQASIYPTGDPIITGQYSALTRAQADPRVSTHSLEVYGQWFDNLVQFDCWSNSNHEANALIAWFEDFMDLYSSVLTQNGVPLSLYWERLQDQTIERWRDDIDNRTIRWYFRTEKLRVKRLRNFRKYNFRLQLGQPNEEVRVYSEPTGISTTTGSYGLNANMYRYETLTGVTGHFTGDNSYLWGQITIEQ